MSAGIRVHGTSKVSGLVFFIKEDGPQFSELLDSGFESETKLD